MRPSRFSKQGQNYGKEHGKTLLSLARGSIAGALGWEARMPSVDEPWLNETRATFVTLKLGGQLRGCVGALEAHRLLAADVVANARAAAFQDARFKPLTREEFERVDIEVSLLSTPTRPLFEDHGHLIAQLLPGVDGLILDCNGRRGTFLPQVWEALPDPEQFVANLKQKAGIPVTERTTRRNIRRYTVLKWREAEMRA